MGIEEACLRGFGTFAAGFWEVYWLWGIGYIVAGSHVYMEQYEVGVQRPGRR